MATAVALEGYLNDFSKLIEDAKKTENFAFFAIKFLRDLDNLSNSNQITI